MTTSDTAAREYATALAKARSLAITELRRNHRGEYDQIVTDYMSDHGFDYTRPMTPQQRAANRIRAIAAEHGLHIVVDEPETS